MDNFVSVGCKLPNGLILRVFEPITRDMPVLGGGTRSVTEFHPTKERHVLNGNTAPYAKPLLDASGNSIPLLQSFAITENIPAEFWELWLEQNKDSEIVRNGLVFAHSKPNELKAMARDHRDARHGLEPIDVHENSGDLRTASKKSILKAGKVSGVSTAQPGASE